MKIIRVHRLKPLPAYAQVRDASESDAAPEARLTPVDAGRAELRFGGFSKVYVHPERRQPERFDDHEVRPMSQWNPTPGYYTGR